MSIHPVPHLVRALALLAAGLLAVLSVSAASAHAGLEESDPPANAIVSEAPDAVTMRFTEPLEWSGTTAELHDASGALVEGTEVREGADEYEMVLALPEDLPDGTYSVLWRTLSTADGHPAQNYFAFTVGTEGDVAATSLDVRESNEPPLWLQTVARWAALLGLAAAVAVWPVWVLVIRPAATRARQVDERLVRRVRGYAGVALVAALAGDLLALGVQAAVLTGSPWLDAVWTTLVDTRYGEYWLLRVAALAALAMTLRFVSWRSPGRRLAPSMLAMLLAVALVIPFSFVAHASAQTAGRSNAIFADVLHLLGAAFWTGGLFAIVAVLLPAVRTLPAIERRTSLSVALRRFSTLALIAWTAMALTGVYSAWLHVGSLEALRETDYGVTLLTKLALLAPALVLAVFNQRVVMPSLERFAGQPSRIATWQRRFLFSIAGEVALVILVLGTVGALTAQAPSRGTETARAERIRAELTGGERDAAIEISPGEPGPNRFNLTLGGDPLAHDTEVLLRVSSDERNTGEKELAFTHTGGTAYTYEGSELSIAGEWELELIVRPADAFEWRAHGAIALGSGANGATTPSWVLSGVGGWIGMVLVLGGTIAAILWWRRPGDRPGTPLLAGGVGAVLLGAVLLWTAREDAITSVARVLTGLR